MDETIYYTKLFDIYFKLLTDKQCDYFRLYYFENLSIDEISELEKISKAAVSKQINTAKKYLEDFENKLNILKRRELIEKEFKNEKEVLSRIAKYDNI